VLSIRIDMLFFRGGIAEALYEASAQAQAAVSAPAIEEKPSAVEGLLWSNATPRDGGAAGHLIARCYAREDRPLIHQLLQTKPGSKNETRVLRAIAPELAPCLPRGKAVTLNSMLMRGSLAEALYRRQAGLGTAGGTRP
jgi:hypothetical protein